MSGMVNSGNWFGTRDVKSLKLEDTLEMAKIEMYSSKLRDLRYSEDQINSAIEKLRSHAPAHYPYLLGAVLYSIKTKLYQQIEVSELKQELESIIEKSKSPKLSRSLYYNLEALDFIFDKIVKWGIYYSNATYGPWIEYEYLFRKLKLKELRGYRYNILPPSRALELFLKYLSKRFYRIRKPSKKAIIKSIEGYLRKKIEELKRYEEENLPKLLDESVERIIEIYEKLKPIIENYSTYIEKIEINAKKSLNDLENEDKKRHSSYDYHFELHKIDKKLRYAAEMRNYIEGILEMSYIIVTNKVSIDEIMRLLNETEDPLLNLKEAYNLLSSKQWKLFNCEILKYSWCTKR